MLIPFCEEEAQTQVSPSHSISLQPDRYTDGEKDSEWEGETANFPSIFSKSSCEHLPLFSSPFPPISSPWDGVLTKWQMGGMHNT